MGWQAVEDSSGLSVPNYTAATMDGLSFETLGADAPAEPAAIYEFVRAQLLPHVFRALVWGVKDRKCATPLICCVPGARTRLTTVNTGPTTGAPAGRIEL